MKSILIIAMLAIAVNADIIFLNEDAKAKCPKWVCSSTVSDKDGACLKGEGKMTETRTITVNKCSSGNACNSEGDVFSDNKIDGKCKAQDKPTDPKHYLYPGEEATKAEQCLGVTYFKDDGTRVDKAADADGDFADNKCVGSKKDKKCVSNSSCIVGLYCKKTAATDAEGVCADLLAKDAVCTASKECKDNLFCHGKDTKKCIDAFSLAKGTELFFPEGEVALYGNFVCASGEVNSGKCVDKKYDSDAHKEVLDSGLVKCDYKSKCKYNYWTSDKDKTAAPEEDCNCGLNGDGFGYCPFATNDDKVTSARGSKIISIYKETFLANGRHTEAKTQQSLKAAKGKTLTCLAQYANSMYAGAGTCFKNEDCTEISSGFINFSLFALVTFFFALFF